MIKLQIKLFDENKSKEMINIARNKSILRNNEQINEMNLLDIFRSPKTKQKYRIGLNSNLINDEGEEVININGIHDFTIYTTEAWDEKDKQSSFHDDEEGNETFSEIVLRPFNYNKLHAKIWHRHLYDFVENIEKISNKDISSFSILNCGCGGGFEAQFLAQQGARVVGFDISQLRAEASATRFSLNNLKGYFYRGDASILPFKDNAFDIVLFHDSLHHVPIEEIPLAIKEARRVAKTFIVLMEAHDSPIRMFLESIGFSTSIESSGNYTFRFKPSLIEFWCKRFGMKKMLYKSFLLKKEHRAKIYKIPILGFIYYKINLTIGFFINKLGNEAIIILNKITG